MEEKESIFPKELNGFTLKKSAGNLYAFYEKDLGFEFKHGIEVGVGHPKEKPEKKIVFVHELSGNTWGKGTWILCNTKYFWNIEDALAHLKGETRVYKPKRKPELIREVTEEELKKWLEEKE
jgi:hypothetical protein